MAQLIGSGVYSLITSKFSDCTSATQKFFKGNDASKICNPDLNGLFDISTAEGTVSWTNMIKFGNSDLESELLKGTTIKFSSFSGNTGPSSLLGKAIVSIQNQVSSNVHGLCSNNFTNQCSHFEITLSQWATCKYSKSPFKFITKGTDFNLTADSYASFLKLKKSTPLEFCSWV